jgi:hypothetical protein
MPFAAHAQFVFQQSMNADTNDDYRHVFGQDFGASEASTLAAGTFK